MQYEESKIGVDPVIFTIKDNKLKVFLKEREKEPFTGKKELPGGLLLPTETAEETLKRKLSELLDIEEIYFKQFFTFTNPTRDPRSRVISISFIALINQEKINDQSHWFDYEEIQDLAFDHLNIIKTAREYLKKNVDPEIIKQFIPELFPLNRLQEVYEIIEEKEYDNRNFRKKMISSEIVEETQERETNVSHRPAKLFKFRL